MHHSSLLRYPTIHPSVPSSCICSTRTVVYHPSRFTLLLRNYIALPLSYLCFLPCFTSSFSILTLISGSYCRTFFLVPAGFLLAFCAFLSFFLLPLSVLMPTCCRLHLSLVSKNTPGLPGCAETRPNAPNMMTLRSLNYLNYGCLVRRPDVMGEDCLHHCRHSTLLVAS